MLRLLVAGQTNAEIAEALVVSINTVKDHVGHLYSKPGVHNRLQAREMAHHLKLVLTLFPNITDNYLGLSDATMLCIAL